MWLVDLMSKSNVFCSPDLEKPAGNDIINVLFLTTNKDSVRLAADDVHCFTLPVFCCKLSEQSLLSHRLKNEAWYIISTFTRSPVTS